MNWNHRWLKLPLTCYEIFSTNTKQFRYTNPRTLPCIQGRISSSAHSTCIDPTTSAYLPENIFVCSRTILALNWSKTTLTRNYDDIKRYSEIFACTITVIASTVLEKCLFSFYFAFRRKLHSPAGQFVVCEPT